MKIELDLNDITLAYLKELSEEHKITPDEVVEALLIGFGLSGLNNIKTCQKSKKRKDLGCSCYGSNSLHKCLC